MKRRLPTEEGCNINCPLRPAPQPAACDAGSLAVFASVFYLPPPRALNFLINQKFRKPTCVLTVRWAGKEGRGGG